MNKNKLETFFKYFFQFFAILAIVFLGLITIFILFEGIKPFLWFNPNGTVNFWEFLTGLVWDPSNKQYGIGYMIIATILAIGLAMIFTIPLSLLTAMAVVELLPKKLREIIIMIIDLLAGIPSIIFGIFGLGFIVPLILNLPMNNEPQGNSLLAVSIVLTIMVLPTITAVAISSLKSVPKSYIEASLGLGATKIQTLLKITLPSASRGILAGIILGIGRAVGETMAVILVAGNVSGGLVDSIFAPIRPLTANIALDMSYSTGLHKELLFSTALILFIIVFILNIILQRLIKKGK